MSAPPSSPSHTPTTETRQAPGFYRFKLGNFSAVALHNGTFTLTPPPGFVTNVADDVFADALGKIGFLGGKLTLTFSHLAVDTGDHLILIDAGNGGGRGLVKGQTLSNLALAGYQTDDVDFVLISHFHADHISGLLSDGGAPAFPNAKILVPRAEWAFWMNENEPRQAEQRLKPTFALARDVFTALGDRVSQFDWGTEVYPGITSIQADGHTPGQSAFRIQSQNDVMVFVADITNNPLLFARNPDWTAAFDIDPQRAVATRKRLLDEAADKRTLLFFFHAPFPGLGYVTRNGAGYDYLPMLWKGDD